MLSKGRARVLVIALEIVTAGLFVYLIWGR